MALASKGFEVREFLLSQRLTLRVPACGLRRYNQPASMDGIGASIDNPVAIIDSERVCRMLATRRADFVRVASFGADQENGFGCAHGG